MFRPTKKLVHRPERIRKTLFVFLPALKVGCGGIIREMLVVVGEDGLVVVEKETKKLQAKGFQSGF